MEKREKKQLVVMVVLIILLAGVWLAVLSGTRTADDRTDTQERIESTETEAPGRPDTETIRARETQAAAFLAMHGPDSKYVEPVRRDIFYREIPEPEEEEDPEALPDLRLTSILWSEENPLAVINQRVVRPGDVLAEEFTVERILPQSVTLSRRRNDSVETFELLLPE